MSTLERLERANPVTDADRLLSAPGAMDDFILAVKQRSGIVQTAGDRAPIEVPTQTKTKPPDKDWRRRLVPSLVAAAAVIAAIVVAVTLLDESDVTGDVPLTPLEVGEALNQATITGDVEAARRLYADDATFSTSDSLVPGGAVEDVPLAEPIDLPDPDIFDWDDDGKITRFDSRFGFKMEAYAGGVTRFYSCSQADPTTVVCDTLYEGYAFLTGDPFALTDTFTVVEGRITQQRTDFSVEGNAISSTSLRIEYHEWVRTNRSEMEAELFEDFGNLLISPDTVEPHRQLIAEWQAQR